MIPHEESILSKDIFSRLANVPLIDKYEAFQLLDDEWKKIAVDLEIFQTEGMEAATKVDPNMVLKKKDGKDEEVQDGWVGRIMPFALIQEQLLPDDLNALKQKENELAEVVSEHEQLVEEMSEEDKNGDFFDTEKNDFVPAEVKKALKEKTEEPDLLAVLKKADALINREKTLKKTLKTDTAVLQNKTKETIEKLTPEQVDMLLEVKWIHPLVKQIHTLPARIIAELNQKIKALSQKYTETLPQLEQQIEKTESELSLMLDQLTGSDDDMSGLAEFKKLLGGK